MGLCLSENAGEPNGEGCPHRRAVEGAEAAVLEQRHRQQRRQGRRGDLAQEPAVGPGCAAGTRSHFASPTAPRKNSSPPPAASASPSNSERIGYMGRDHIMVARRRRERPAP